MRPPGEVRAALRDVFSRLAVEHGPAGWREVLPLLAPLGIDPRSSAEVRLVRKTVERMVLAGELQAVGRTKDAGQRVWRCLYEPAAPRAAHARPGRQAQPFVDLARATRAWVIR